MLLRRRHSMPATTVEELVVFFGSIGILLFLWLT
jgi:hypothetical protein